MQIPSPAQARPAGTANLGSSRGALIQRQTTNAEEGISIGKLTAKEAQKRLSDYFSRCDEAHAFYGEAGLSLALGIRLDTLRDYYDGRQRPELQDTIQQAYLRIQEQLERQCADKSLASRAMFLLKQPRLGGYSEKGTSSGEVTVRIELGQGTDESDFE